MPITTEQYQDLVFETIDYIKTNIIVPNSAGSHVETRYIASEGRDDESWLGYLRDENGVVDIWLMTINFLQGVPADQREDQAIGTFSKPLSITLDYFADYRQGIDYVENVATNSEREFLKKVLAVDLALEQKRNCLKDSVMINAWDFRIKLRRFATASTHWASGNLELSFEEIFLI